MRFRSFSNGWRCRRCRRLRTRPDPRRSPCLPWAVWYRARLSRGRADDSAARAFQTSKSKSRRQPEAGSNCGGADRASDASIATVLACGELVVQRDFTSVTNGAGIPERIQVPVVEWVTVASETLGCSDEGYREGSMERVPSGYRVVSRWRDTGRAASGNGGGPLFQPLLPMPAAQRFAVELALRALGLVRVPTGAPRLPKAWV